MGGRGAVGEGKSGRVREEGMPKVCTMYMYRTCRDANRQSDYVYSGSSACTKKCET